MDQHKRRQICLLGFHTDEMNRLPIDFGGKVRQLVELCFFLSQLKAKHFFRWLLHVGKFWSALILPSDHGGLAGALQTVMQIVKRILRHITSERIYSHLDLLCCCL